MKHVRKALAAVCLCALIPASVSGCGPADTSVESGTLSEGEASVVSEAAMEPDKYKPTCEIDDYTFQTGLCVSESYTNDSIKNMKQRLTLYKELGFETIRLSIEWRNIEPNAEGVFTKPLAAYLYTAKEMGFRVKMILGTFMGIPNWFAQKYPEAQMMNSEGVRSTGVCLSYNTPELREYLQRALDAELSYLQESGFLEIIDTIVVDCGPAGEALYPADWTQSEGGGESFENVTAKNYFWGYDQYSQQDFRQTMQEKYGTIAAANAAWGKSFSSFDQMEVPKPGGPGGGIWADYLNWYRDAKNRFVSDQVAMYKTTLKKYDSDGRIKLLIYIPGSDVRDDAWEEALQSGDGIDSIKVMCDSRFIMNTAKENGLVLQYTGFENAGETSYLCKYMRENGMEDIPIFGENAGQYNAAANAASLVQVVRLNGMAGIDLTHSRFLVEANGITPTAHVERVRKAMKTLRNYLRPEAET